MLSSGLVSSNEFRYKFQRRRNGVVIEERPWKSNLIQDVGLDSVAFSSWVDLFTYMHVGNAVSPVPVRRDSNAVTIAIAGNTATASGSFFVAQDVGRILKLNDLAGTERYIIGFTNSLVVALGGASATVASINGTVWYVNETAMTNQVLSGNTYGSNGGDNGETWGGVNGGTRTLKRTIILSAVGGTTTLTEIAFSGGAANSNLFDRDIITGGVTLSAGDQPSAVVELIQTFTPVVPLSVGNVGTGLDTSGQLQLETSSSQGYGMGGILASGGSQLASGYCVLEPFNGNGAGGVSLILAPITLQAFDNSIGNISTPQRAGNGGVGFSLASYTSGSFFRDRSFAFPTNYGNGSCYGYAIGLPVSTPGTNGSCFLTQAFTTPFTKLSTQVLTGTWRYSWQRILVN